MKDLKITIAKGIIIFIVFVMVVEVAVAVFFGVWVVPDAFWDVFWEAIYLSAWFCCGCLLAFFAAAMAARQFARSAMLAVFCVIYAVAFYQEWMQFDSSRLLTLVLVSASVCFGAVLVCCKPFPKRGTVQKVIVIYAIVLGLPLGGITALGVLLHGDTWDTLEKTVNSPDGRYQAVLTDRLEGDSEYDLVTINPTYFSMFHILDYPNREIIEMAYGEALKSVRWANPRTLVVEYYSGTSFAQQDKSWWDVKIVYKKEGKTPTE